MKTTLLLLSMSAVAALAQPTADTDTKNQAEFLRSTSERLTQEEEKANEIIAGRFVYSGIAIQLVTADNPLQLVNPVAPARYGTTETSVVKNPSTGRAEGLKVFSIGF